MMDRKKLTFAVAVVLVPVTIVHADEGAFKGENPHMITAAPLVSSTVSVGSMDFIHRDTIVDQIHMASVPQESELRLGGLYRSL